MKPSRQKVEQCERKWNKVNKYLTWKYILKYRFVYASSGVKAAYVNWYTGEPNDYGGEDCVELRRFTDAAKDESKSWNDQSCDDMLPFVCQMHTTTSGTTEGSNTTDDPSTGSIHTHTSTGTTDGRTTYPTHTTTSGTTEGSSITTS